MRIRKKDVRGDKLYARELSDDEKKELRKQFPRRRRRKVKNEKVLLLF